MNSLPWVQIILITVIAWIGGALWFSPLMFGKRWMKIHHAKVLTEAQMKDMSKGMAILMMWEMIATLLMVIGLACVIRAIPEYSGVKVAFMTWLAFALPVTISTVLWGNDKKNVMCEKIALSAGYRLVVFLAAGYVISCLA